MNELDQAFIRAFEKRPNTHQVIQQLRAEDSARTFRFELGSIVDAITSAPVQPTSSPSSLSPAPIHEPTNESRQAALHAAHPLQGPHHHLALAKAMPSPQSTPLESNVNPANNSAILVMSATGATAQTIDCADVVGVYHAAEETATPTDTPSPVEEVAAERQSTQTSEKKELGEPSASDSVAPSPMKNEQVKPPSPPPAPPSPAPRRKLMTMKPFVPAWEVDQFEWPAVCEQLVNQQWLKGVGQQLSNANRDGLKIMAVTGLHVAEGRTTLSICLARSASQAGLRVGLVDADFRSPGLAERLGVAAPTSWLDALQSGSAFEETAILSAGDDITLFPLGHVSARNLGGHLKQVSNWLTTLAGSFDLLIVDAGAQSSSSHQFIAVNTAEAIDAVTIVRDMRRTTETDLETAIRRIQLAGIEAVGVIENFGNWQADMERASA